MNEVLKKNKIFKNSIVTGAVFLSDKFLCINKKYLSIIKNMKYFGAFLTIIMAILAMFLCLPAQSNYEYLRIHIRANSNMQIDQQIKYQIKEEVVDYLTPYLVSALNKDDAIKIVSALTDNIKITVDNVLEINNFNYLSSVCVTNEQFPARTYEGLTLKSGNYDALIINLGSGQGDNWWCVVYPPLCFVSSQASNNNIYYKSKLKEIIDKFFK